MNNLLHHTTALKSRSKGLRFDLESPMESSASADQLSPRTRQRERIKTVRNIGIRTIASIIVLGLLCVGSIQNLDWHIDGIKQKHDEQEQTEKALYTQPVEKIVLLGERHSGTNWITNHLTECFHGDHLKVTNLYSDWDKSALCTPECINPKHRFQEDDVERVPENSAVVVAMFRDPYAWVEAMRVEPHHAHNHINLTQFTNNNKKGKGWKQKGGEPLGWKEFVTKPWVGETESRKFEGLGRNFYEMQVDGSGRAYSSIIDLRRDKIINHLSVANFVGTRTFLPMRYEDLNANGTSVLLRSIEEATGQRANCSAVIGKGPISGKGRRRLREKRITKHAKLPDEFIDWMNEFVDWEVESRIGYYRRVVSDV